MYEVACPKMVTGRGDIPFQAFQLMERNKPLINVITYENCATVAEMFVTNEMKISHR